MSFLRLSQLLPKKFRKDSNVSSYSQHPWRDSDGNIKKEMIILINRV